MAVNNTTKITRDQDITNFNNHKEDIRLAAEHAKTTIADAAGLASKAIADAAAISVKVLSIKNADDHDLLIELKVGNQFIRDDIKNLSSGISVKIEQLQEGKLDRKYFDEFKKTFDELDIEIHTVTEKRMRVIEDRTFNVWIALGFVMIGIGALFTIFIVHISK